MSVPLRKLRAHALSLSRQSSPIEPERPPRRLTAVCSRLPELTPHARQAAWADALIEVHDNPDQDVFVATTMELVILRLLRRVRQGKLKASHLRVVVLTKDGTSHFCRVGDDGEFLDVWPEGFYDARMAELF